MKLLHNSEIQIEKWNDLRIRSSHSSPFQTFEFFHLNNSVPGLSAEVYAVEDSGELKSLCVITIHKESGMKAYFSRRAIIYGGPLFIDNDFYSVIFLLENVGHEFNKKVIYIEVRNYTDYNNLKPLYIKTGWHWLPYLNIKLPLKNKSLNGVLGIMKYNRRREIKQSLNEGAIYREANNIQEVENLYLILKEIYLNKIKLPIPKLDFFLAIYRSIIGKVFIVLHNEQIIGGAFCFFLENESIYTMYYCGKRNYHMKIFPTHLSILAAIEFGIKKKLEYIDFMGAGVNGKEYGVRKYKLEFGGELVEEGRYIKINNQLLYKIGGIALKLMKMLKI